MINTINNRVYNADERRKLSESLEALKAARDAELDEADKITDNNEWHEAGAKIYAKYDPLIYKAIDRCYYAQFPKCNNEWFTQVVDGMKKGEAVQISEKQYRAFHKYAKYEDCDSWQNKTTYCRVKKYGVALTWKNANRSIKIIEL